MMVSPESYIIEFENKNYNELLKERDELLDRIKDFEINKDSAEFMDVVVCPSPDVVYQMNLLYLGKLCELISEKYNFEFEGNH